MKNQNLQEEIKKRETITIAGTAARFFLAQCTKRGKNIPKRPQTVHK
jgi:hypothetical protein